MLTAMVAAAIAAQLKIAALQQQAAELDAMRETVELQQMEIEELEARYAGLEGAEWVECGACGAHVHDWWYVTSEFNGNLVEVCHDCYELFVDYYER